MSAVKELLAANARYASQPTVGRQRASSQCRVAVLTCMDSRLLPHKFLGLQEGDATVIRNAGGRASQDALRSLIVSYKLLGAREILVIHHTDCGMCSFDSGELREQLRRDTGADASGIDFLTFTDLDESVRDDVRTIRDSPLIPDTIPVTGFVLDVESRRLREVTCAA